MQKRYVLSEPVVISGKDVFGRDSEVVIGPSHRPGWFWRVDDEDVLIRPEMLDAKHHHLTLRHAGRAMHVFEHLGPLRFLGLDCVRITPNSSWLPYDGGAMIFYEAVRPFMREEGSFHRCHEPFHNLEINGKRALKIALFPHDDFQLSITVDNEWGTISRDFKVIFDTLIDLFASKPLANPKWLKRVLPALGWPHMEKVLWPQGREPQGILEEMARHRALDLLGALSAVIPPGCYLSGRAASVRGNHSLDVRTLRPFNSHR